VGSAAARQLGSRTVLGVPLLREGAAIGVIYIRRTEVQPFTEAQIALLKTFADQAVIAIENVRLFNELQEKNRALTEAHAQVTESLEQQTATSEILSVISSSPTDAQPVFDTIVRNAVRLCEAMYGTVSLADGELIRLVAHSGLTVGQVEQLKATYPRAVIDHGAIPTAIRTGLVVRVADLDAEAHAVPADVAAHMRARGVRSVLVVPMLRQGQAIGSINVTHRDVGAFTDTHVDLLKTFADQAVIAIENVRLFKELQEKNRALTDALEQQTATSEILSVISQSPTDVQPVFDTIVRSGARLCNATTAAVVLTDGTMMRVPANYGSSPEVLAEARALWPRPLDGTTAAGMAILTRSVIQIPDSEDPSTSEFVRKSGRLLGYRSSLAVPMLRGAEAIGAIRVTRAESGRFRDAEIDLLKTFADQAVLAIENVRLFKEIENRNRDLTATSEILQAIAASPAAVQPVFDTIVRNAVALCGAFYGIIWRYDNDVVDIAGVHNIPAGEMEELRRQFPRAIEDAAMHRHLRSGNLLDVPDVEMQQDLPIPPDARSRWRSRGVRSVVVVPMRRRAEVVGAIGVSHRDTGAFSADRINLLKTFADQAVIAIENVRLFTELQEKNRALTQAHAQVSEALERQTATSEILGVISSSPTDVQPVFDSLVASAARLCGANDVLLLIREGDVLRPAAGMGAFWGSLAADFRVPLVRGSVAARSVLDGTTLHIADLAVVSEAEFSLGRDLQRRFGHRTVLAVPLFREGLALGTIFAMRFEVRPFAEQQIALLKTFADQAVIAIENVRLFKELQEKNEALTRAHGQVTEALERQMATSDILRVIASSPTDAQPVFDTIAASAKRLCDALHSSVFQVDGEWITLVAADGSPQQLEVIRRAYPAPPGRTSLAAKVILERRVIAIADAQNDIEHPLPERAKALGFRSVVCVPMLRGDTPIGAIAVVRAEAIPFADAQITLLQTFADQAVIAIENVRLFTELEEKNRALTQAHAQVSEALEQQTATSDILRVISSSATDVQPVFDTILASALRLLQGYSGGLTRISDGQLVLVALTSTDSAADAVQRARYPQSLDSSDDPHAHAVRTRAPVNVANMQGEARFSDAMLAAARARGFHSLVAVPLLRHDEPLGAITITRRDIGAFTNEEIALLQTFADQAVIAIENARLLSELRARTEDLTRSVDELTALGEVGRALSSTLNLEAVLQTIVTRANQLARTAGCVIWEYDKPRGEFRLRVSHYADDSDAATLPASGGLTTIPKGQGLTTKVMEERRAVQIPDITVEGAYESPVRKPLIDAGHRALLGVPLLIEDEIIGVLAVTRKTPGTFEPESVRLLSSFATQSALAIQNARLFREIEQKSRELEAASRHKSEFLANMSHELRTPLNAIIGFSEVLGERMFGELNEKQDEYLKDIHASGQHLLSLINDILDLSKIEAGKMELELSDFDLSMTIENALMLIRERAARKGVELHRSVDERLGQVQADERKIRQVLLNLFSNAIKFTPEGGRIDVGAKPVNGSIEVSVTDTGVGIAPEDQEAVFEEFRQVGTADKKVEGTGLGLALSRKFIELHGGKIWAKSQVGAGSTFTFTLPVRRG
jgi:GAF domain-containing protein